MDPPKKYVKADGRMILNPEYTDWMNNERAKEDAAPPFPPTPSESPVAMAVPVPIMAVDAVATEFSSSGIF